MSQTDTVLMPTFNADTARSLEHEHAAMIYSTSPQWSPPLGFGDARILKMYVNTTRLE